MASTDRDRDRGGPVAGEAAPRGASATSSSRSGQPGHGHSQSQSQSTQQQQARHGHSQSHATNNTQTSTSSPRLMRGNSFRIPLPPSSPSMANNNSATSPGGTNSPGASNQQGNTAILGSSYGSSSGGTGSRLGSFALGFRRNRGQSTNRGEITTPVGGAAAGGPPSPPAFPALQASTSLTDFSPNSPYFDGADGGGQGLTHAGAGNSSSSNNNTGGGRGYFSRRGFGRKNTGGLLGGMRTPTSENPPPAMMNSSAGMQRERSSSQPSMPASMMQQQQTSSTSAAAAVAAQQGLPQPPVSAGAIPSSTSGPIGTSSSSMTSGAALVSSATAATLAGEAAAVNPSSRRASGEAARGPAMGSAAAPAQPASSNAAPPAAASTSGTSSDAQHIRLVPHLDATRSLHFEPVSRDVAPTIPLRIGRFTDRNPNQPISALDQNRVAFKSKVVSRTHAEIWYDAAGGAGGSAGGWFIRDLKSSSGTFLNHIRLSGAGMESRPFPIRDGDVLQLGVDYQGGTEEIYRCVKMRIELNRGWQRGANSFNTNALRQIRALGNVDPEAAKAGAKPKSKKKKKSKKVKKSAQSTDAEQEGTAEDDVDEATGKVATKSAAGTGGSSAPVTDCCICLFSVTVYQALFIAPCSHIFHFKCIHPLILQHHPGFSCPLCRTFADLDADVEQDDVPEQIAEESESEESEEEDADAQAQAQEEDAVARTTVDSAAVSATSDPIAEQASSSGNAPTPLAAQATSSALAHLDTNMDTLRPGRKSPRMPSGPGFGASTSTVAPGLSGQTTTRVSSEAVRPPSPGSAAVNGRQTPQHRRSSSNPRGLQASLGTPPSGAAVAAALERHSTPHQLHQSHSGHSQSHHSDRHEAFSPPSAGDFDPDIRRSSIFVHGADGHAMQIPITGRSRPGSVYDVDIHSESTNGHGGSHAHAPSPSDRNKARSVRSLGMSQSRASMSSLRNHAAGGQEASLSHAPLRRGPSAPSSSDDSEQDIDLEPPVTARAIPGSQDKNEGAQASSLASSGESSNQVTSNSSDKPTTEPAASMHVIV